MRLNRLRLFPFVAFACFASSGYAACQENASAKRIRLKGEIVDAETGRVLPGRVYLTGADGVWHFVRSADPNGSAIKYDKTNWINARSFEKHVTISAHPFFADLPPGEYSLHVERGKEYLPHRQKIVLSDKSTSIRIPLKRWTNLAEKGWYSGETHIHRKLDELPNVLLAEDLNVAFPLTYWVTHAYASPTSGDKNIGGEIPDRLIEVDKTHVIWPRNTEYEIFTVGKKQHTLGAVFMLNHKSVLQRGIPPVAQAAKLAADEGAMFDIDKPDWPFAMTLLHSSGATLFELANNHMWRTEFAFRTWNTPTPGFLQPPLGGKKGNERDWLHYTLGVYYTLLDAGHKLVPTAGTANGVHPAPAGFSRVYVHLPNGFTYDSWVAAFRKGRSFVTTGPMLFAEVDGKKPGETFRIAASAKLKVHGTVQSEHPLAFIEVVVNGKATHTIFAQNKLESTGARTSPFSVELSPETTGWICVRCFEDRPDGRVRFAHSAPWWVEVPGKPLLPTQDERDYLVRRVKDEIERSKGVLSAEAIDEYRAALAKFESLKTAPDDKSNARKGDESTTKAWLQNMVGSHGFTFREASFATGLSERDVQDACNRWEIRQGASPARKPGDPLLVLPYPGGRHPRTGFRDGALHPQREAKVSVFTPWDPKSYVVVDVPEAIWSNLGLTYLAHTHVPTIWDRQKIPMRPLEWKTRPDGALTVERALPNGLSYGALVLTGTDGVRMELSLKNGTKERLSALRAQVCAMLQGAAGFHDQTATNKVMRNNAIACRDETGARWIVMAWSPIHRAWGNPPVPCIHADPSFSDCEPGQTVRARGLLAFHEGASADEAIDRTLRLLDVWNGKR